jgi:hypothetical protein
LRFACGRRALGPVDSASLRRTDFVGDFAAPFVRRAACAGDFAAAFVRPAAFAAEGRGGFAGARSSTPGAGDDAVTSRRRARPSRAMNAPAPA